MPEEVAKSASIDSAKGILAKILKFLQYLTAPPNTSKKSFYFTLALYDVDGEAVEKEVEQIERIKNRVDKIALVIDAMDLLEVKTNEKGILAKHRRGLKRLKELGGKPFCVILTKTDLFTQYLKNNPAFNAKVLQNWEDFFKGDQTAIKGLLQYWKQIVTENPISADSQKNLLNFLSELISLENQTPIFMLATKNLPTDAEKMVEVQPFSYGLDTFVCWCLEIKREEIIETSQTIRDYLFTEELNTISDVKSENGT